MQKKPWLLYILVVFGIILDIISFLFLVIGVGNVLGFLVSTVGFFVFFIVIGMHIMNLTQHIARQKMKHKQMVKKQQNPLVQKQMKKARKKFAEAVGSEIIKMKSRKILYSVLAKIVTLMPILGSFVPAYSIKAIVILRQNKKFMKLLDRMDLSVTGLAKTAVGGAKGMAKQGNTSNLKKPQNSQSQNQNQNRQNSQSQNAPQSNQYVKDAQELNVQSKKLSSSIGKSASQYRDNPQNSLGNIMQEKIDENEPDPGKRKTGSKNRSNLYQAKYDQSQPSSSNDSSPEDPRTNLQNTQDTQSQNQDSSSSKESSVSKQNKSQFSGKSSNGSESSPSSENSSYSDIHPQDTSYTTQTYQGDSQDVFDQIDPSSQSSTSRNSRSASRQQSSGASENLSSGTIDLKSSASPQNRAKSHSSSGRSRTSQSQGPSSSKSYAKNTVKPDSESQSRSRTSQSSGKSSQFIRPSVGNSSKKRDI